VRRGVRALTRGFGFDDTARVRAPFAVALAGAAFFGLALPEVFRVVTMSLAYGVGP
jgi:hypothetical protein